MTFRTLRSRLVRWVARRLCVPIDVHQSFFRYGMSK
jgi:hypothetical protein